MQSLKSIISGPICKNIILTAFTMFISIALALLENWDASTVSYFGLKLVVFIMLLLLYFGLIIFYATTETNDRKIASVYSLQNKTYEELNAGIMNLCKNSTNNVNKVIKSIVTENKINLELWNFDEACVQICANIYGLMCTLGNGTEYEIVYVRLDESVKPEAEIYANAYANQSKSHPSIYRRKRHIDTDIYYDTKLFQQNQSDMDIRVDSEEIDEVFSHGTNEKRKKNKKKYNQYVAIPIYCHDEKMIGLLEIVCLNKTFLRKTKEEIRELVLRYVMPYVFLAMVLHKMEKALLAQPKEADPHEK